LPFEEIVKSFFKDGPANGEKSEAVPNDVYGSFEKRGQEEVF
jgi:hypothetical protein